MKICRTCYNKAKLRDEGISVARPKDFEDFCDICKTKKQDVNIVYDMTILRYEDILRKATPSDIQNLAIIRGKIWKKEHWQWRLKTFSTYEDAVRTAVALGIPNGTYIIREVTNSKYLGCSEGYDYKSFVVEIISKE